MRGHFIDLLGDADMGEAVALLGGGAAFQLQRMLEEGTTWEAIEPVLAGASDGDKAAIRADTTIRDGFVEVLGDDDMLAAVKALDGDLAFALEWILAEGTSWTVVSGLIEPASDDEKKAVRESPELRAALVELLDDGQMADAVALLGGGAAVKLRWLLAEGTSWAAVETLVKGAEYTEKAEIRASSELRAVLVLLLDDDEMATLVGHLGGSLAEQLTWLLAEGTTWETVRDLVKEADDAGKASLREDATLLELVVTEFGDDRVAELVDLAGGDLLMQLTWTLSEGTTWEAAKGRIEKADGGEYAAVRASARGVRRRGGHRGLLLRRHLPGHQRRR